VALKECIGAVIRPIVGKFRYDASSALIGAKFCFDATH
jgi:hypothetical protein